MRLIII